jgi:hypothetical protein
MTEFLIILVIVGYVTFHHHCYRRHRRHGLSVWVSCRGPFHTRISKRI